MTVKQLIARLKKMPQSADVGFRDHDALEYEVSSWVESVSVLDKDDITLPSHLDRWEVERYSQLKGKTVVLG